MGPPTFEFWAKTYYLAIFPRKLHENERNWTEKGMHPCPSLGSANDVFIFFGLIDFKEHYIVNLLQLRYIIMWYCMSNIIIWYCMFIIFSRTNCSHVTIGMVPLWRLLNRRGSGVRGSYSVKLQLIVLLLQYPDGILSANPLLCFTL